MINIYGAKNSLLPIIASTVLSKNTYTLKNCIFTTDIISQLNILFQFGAKYSFDPTEKILEINTKDLFIPKFIDFSNSTRANYYFIGSSLHYNKALEFLISNGCNIDQRGIDFHLKILNILGKNFKLNNDKLFIDSNKILSNQTFDLIFPKPSVGATINTLLMFCQGPNAIALKNYAKDPYIFEQIRFLKLLGADIKVSDSSIVVSGTKLVENKQIVFDIIPDPIEALSYIIFGAICLLKNKKHISKFTIGPIHIEHLGSAIDKLKEIGVNLIRSDHDHYFYIQIIDNLKPFHISTDYFPGIYTDSQPFFALLASFIDGESQIKDTVYPQRFAYVDDYAQYGIDIILKDGVAHINGKNPNEYPRLLTAKQIYLKDLRSGASTFLLNKILDSPYSIYHTKYIDRGYFDYDYKSNQILCDLNVSKEYSTAELSNIRIGGKSRFYTEAYEAEDIEKAISFSKKEKCKFSIIGDGCNIYFSSYYDGIIIKNNIKFHKVIDLGDAIEISIGSGNLLQDLVDIASKNKVDIHELCDIPGTVGGAIYGNAGAYGVETKDFLKSAMVYDLSESKFKSIGANDLYLSYRNSGIKSKKLDYIITEGVFVFHKSNLDIKSIIEKNKKVSVSRRLKMPYNNTLGCIFKNPNNHKAGEILDPVFHKGSVEHNIRISNNHSNIWINTGDCKPEEFDNFIVQIQQKIKMTNNIDLELEIEKI